MPPGPVCPAAVPSRTVCRRSHRPHAPSASPSLAREPIKGDCGRLAAAKPASRAVNTRQAIADGAPLPAVHFAGGKKKRSVSGSAGDRSSGSE